MDPVSRFRPAIWMTCAAMVAIAGCGRPSPSAPRATGDGAPAGEPVPGDWIVERLNAEPAILNPHIDTADSYTVQILSTNVFESLLSIDNETLGWKPGIAESWEESEDHLTYTFYIDKRVKCSDGTPMNAHDVKFTFDTLMNKDNDTAEIRGYLEDIESISLLDDYTIQFKMKRPYFLSLTVLGSYVHIFPKHIYGAHEYNSHPNNRNPIGTGPYVFERWDTGQQIVLAKNPDYWKGEIPHVDKFVYKFITDENAAFQVLQRGDVDVMRVASTEDWVRKTDRPEFLAMYNKHVMTSPSDGYASTYRWIGWNSRRPVFADKRVRRAMTMLLDRQTIIDQIMHGYGQVVSGTAAPTLPEYDSSIAPWPYDPAQARALLDEAGWIDSDSDGIRDKDGVKFAFEWMYPSGSPEYDKLATIHKEQMDKAGIACTLRPLEWATFIESVYQRKFDACMMAWVAPPEQDPYQLWHSSQSEAGSNFVGFNNAEADQIIEQARVTFDKEERAKLYRRFHAILHEEQPYTFLFTIPRKAAVAKRFQNVNEYTLGFDFKEWWTPAELQKY